MTSDDIFGKFLFVSGLNKTKTLKADNVKFFEIILNGWHNYKNHSTDANTSLLKSMENINYQNSLKTYQKNATSI